MAQKKTCFVVMPIRREGTDDHRHFRALYEEILKPLLVGHGFEVTRADEVQKSGAITREIVLALAEADLVLADMTDLNPNVFYELGVRHALRAHGTVMIFDEGRTDEVPFDLGSYRVVRFRGELEGFGKLRRELAAFVIAGREQDLRDNPVHDWLPALPANALESSKGSVEGALREQLAKATRRLRDYEDAYGVKDGADVDASSALAVVMDALADAKQGTLPSDLLEQANAAAKSRDKKTFLEIMRRVFEGPPLRFRARGYLEFAGVAKMLGLDGVVKAIFDHGTRYFPKDPSLRTAQLEHFAHSEDPALRERARQEFLRALQITLDDPIHVPQDFGSAGYERTASLGIMLDAFHADDLHEQALKITTAMRKRYPQMSLVVRNHARALEKSGRGEDALAEFRQALFCPDVDDSSAVWLGNELHNRGRHVDAIEVYLCGCLLDPDDGSNFVHVADDLTHALQEAPGRGARDLPEAATLDAVVGALVAAISCPSFDQADLDRARRAARRAEFDIEPLLRSVLLELDEAEPGAGIKQMPRRDRLAFAGSLYRAFLSGLTEGFRLHPTQPGGPASPAIDAS